MLLGAAAAVAAAAVAAAAAAVAAAAAEARRLVGCRGSKVIDLIRVESLMRCCHFHFYTHFRFYNLLVS